ncbi:hypothetical protein EV356DRAFT_506462 [Viridothelium virens]|uniref:Uncharacterized protein n=1 Tax=Viridothelium virens TaxID=1048519 RepID=A0A6A6H1T2_VIRVR|nr:hypothetical protein EV356DRAFT_506462 [Viridothelium virens]
MNACWGCTAVVLQRRAGALRSGVERAYKRLAIANLGALQWEQWERVEHMKQTRDASLGPAFAYVLFDRPRRRSYTLGIALPHGWPLSYKNPSYQAAKSMEASCVPILLKNP